MALVRNITAENFEAMAVAFGHTNDGVCPILSLEPWIQTGIDRPATMGPWMAWREYRIAKKMSVRFMDDQARKNKRWTVPAVWPHEFDGDWSVSVDFKTESLHKVNPFAEKIQTRQLSEDDRKAFVRRVTRAFHS